jgi:transcriptional regulator with XRE-family HTH domain
MSSRLVDLDIYRARFQLIAAVDVHGCGALLRMGAPDRQNPKTKGLFRRPQTLGEHLKKRRRELGLLQREAAERMGVSTDTVVNWEKDNTKPVAAQFRSVVAFLGYDPTPQAQTLADRLKAKQRTLGASLAQVARYLGWDPGSLRRYLDGTWRISPDRRQVLEMFLNAEDVALAGLHSLRRRR